MEAKQVTAGVLINNYNNGPWLRECVDSALGQSHAPDEVIVFDDGSTDKSLAILRGYGDRIRLIEGRHDGTRPGIVAQGAALAAAFAESTADHLYLLDGDDKFLPGKIAAYEAAWALAPDATLVQAPMVLVDDRGGYQRDNFAAAKHVADYRHATYALQDTDLYYATSALAFARDYLRREVPLDYTIHRDAPIDARLAPGAAFFGPVLTLRDPYTWWRQRKGSISQGAGQRDPLTAMRRRHRVFNEFAARHGFAPIRLWRCRRYYRQLARRFAPAWLAAPFVRKIEAR